MRSANNISAYFKAPYVNLAEPDPTRPNGQSYVDRMTGAFGLLLKAAECGVYGREIQKETKDFLTSIPSYNVDEYRFNRNMFEFLCGLGDIADQF